MPARAREGGGPSRARPRFVSRAGTAGAGARCRRMTDRSKDIRDLVVVLLGASSGFGRGAATELAAQGAKVVLAARREELLQELRQEIADAGGEALVAPCDVGRGDEVAAVAQRTLEAYGRIDVWINNVGVGALGFFWDIPVEDQARLVDVNLKGLIYGAHAALRQFRSQGRGVLVNVGSIDSEVPPAFQTVYAATKAAVLSLGRSLNEELRLTGEGEAIKVATVMPWAVDTPWWIHAANYTGHQPRMAAMDDPQLVVDALVEACRDPKEEMPVGVKAKAADLSHGLFPGLTERLTAKVAQKELEKADEAPATSGSLYEPMRQGRGVEGGIRRRREQEDRARRG